MPTSRALFRLTLLTAMSGGVFLGCAANGGKPRGLAPGADVVTIDGWAAHGPGAALALDIENHGGEVLVVVDPSLPMPEVRATSLEANQVRSAAPWAAAAIAPSGVTAAEAAPILRVLGADVAGTNHRTALEVRVPACAGVRVRNQDGGVTLRGVSGAIDVQNGSPLSPGGPITLTTDAPLDAPLLLQTASGVINAELPASSSLALEVTTQSGLVSVQASGVQIQNVKATKQSWTAVLNGGGASAKINADSGDVRVRLVK